MAYIVSLGGVQMPVTPSKIQMKIKNQNKTINLIDGTEINILKAPGLTEFDFEVLIPQVKGYPFAIYVDKSTGGGYADTKFLDAAYYLEFFEKLKIEKQKVKLAIDRTSPDGTVKLFGTDYEMVLEEYSVIEDSNNGLDLTVSLSLKQYRDYQTQVYNVTEDKHLVPSNLPTSKKVPPPYTVKKGDTLWAICKKKLGNGSKYPQIAKLNKIKNPNLIYVGQVIRFG